MRTYGTVHCPEAGVFISQSPDNVIRNARTLYGLWCAKWAKIGEAAISGIHFQPWPRAELRTLQFPMASGRLCFLPSQLRY